MEAASNLKAWLDLLGIEGVGEEWTSATDTYVQLGSVLVLVCIVITNVAPLVISKLKMHPVAAARPISTAPTPKTWISRDEALAILGQSSLVRRRVQNETITGAEALSRALGYRLWKTPGELQSEEMQRKYLRDFELQHPSGVCDEEYGADLLQWWIDEKSVE